MRKCRILYNPLAGNGKGQRNALSVAAFSDITPVYCDITSLEDVNSYLRSVPEDEAIVLAGGDGTLNRFANKLDIPSLNRKIWYYPAGSGNDFMVDIREREHRDGSLAGRPILLNPYLKALPRVYANGQSNLFLNGVGLGLDGYVCDVGDQKRQGSDKPVNYTAIALGALMGKFHPVSATVTVDGTVKEYKKVWMVSSMQGRYYGGGMMIAPGQDRLNEEQTLTFMVLHTASAARILTIFPQIFKGTHVKYTQYLDIVRGHEITVAFDRPCSMQIDGEPVRDVITYTARSAAAEGKHE